MLNQARAKVWSEKMVIPTYSVGEPGKHPIFSDQRVYQGSSGKVYPYAIIETISNEKIDKTYEVVFLENEYLKVMVMPELGGRIHRATDKTNQYDFLYYNQVIKPALVGLLGPWISGGIEFNWPQHHRPTTFMPVDYTTKTYEDGSVSVILMDHDRMYGTKVNTEYRLYPGKAYIEIKAYLSNITPFPQTFLWWANPAIPANEHTQSIFPPDVHAVMDHGKRDVSKFPIATGEYYKHDYSEGVDISFFKNIPVPTSYMAEKSKYDFMGGYDHKKEAGLLHVADHHISPGKKQWTWGNGDFGQAWDRNLTDEDGSYIELMTGVYTDNQPDFTWLKPFEEKSFTQYFMPYKKMGTVKNATVNAAVNLEIMDQKVIMSAYTMGVYPNSRICLHQDGKLVYEGRMNLSPEETFQHSLDLDVPDETALRISILDGEGNELVAYQPEPKVTPMIPEPAEAAKRPEEIESMEELYLTGLHLEQYRHATFRPEDYYKEGLKRDPGESRLNNALGLLHLRRGDFKNAEELFLKSIERLTWKNPNPYNSEPYYHLGLLKMYEDCTEEAYDYFYKATWSAEQQDKAFYYLAMIEVKRGRLTKALEFIEKSIQRNTQSIKAQAMKAIILRKMGAKDKAMAQVLHCEQLDYFDIMIRYEKYRLNETEGLSLPVKDETLLLASWEYGWMGLYEEAMDLSSRLRGQNVLSPYYEAYFADREGLEARTQGSLTYALDHFIGGYFPNRLEDQKVLEAITRIAQQDGKAKYLLGTLYYDKKRVDEAQRMWEESASIDDQFSTVHRNLALLYFNHCNDHEKAKASMEKSFKLDESDARILLELDQLYHKLGWTPEQRVQLLQSHLDTVYQRDDLLVEYILLLQQVGKHEEAYNILKSHGFHPWEGGEGRVTGAYKSVLISLSKVKENEGNLIDAEELLKAALIYPENLGEGKLEGTKDNDLHFFLGKLYEKMGRKEQAQAEFIQATYGTDQTGGVLYYNDQPAHNILYQGLALQKLGDAVGASRKFNGLLEYSEHHFQDEVTPDYFAVSLPHFLVFKEDWTLRNRIHCEYLMALASVGFEKMEEARGWIEKVLEKNPSHMEAKELMRLFLE